MRGILVALMVAAAVAAALVPASAAEAAQREVALQGVIARVGDAAIALQTRERGLVPVGVVERTQIMLNGDDAELGDLQPRDHARVRAVLTGGHRGPRLIGVVIAAHRRG
jgi:hypothetical protein